MLAPSHYLSMCESEKNRSPKLQDRVWIASNFGHTRERSFNETAELVY